MNWLNIEISTIHAPEYVGSEPVERATWINLMVYCASQENGGIIQDCSDWKCRRWQQTCGVTKEEISSDCELWEVDNDGNLHVWGYPIDKEIEVKAKRIGGSKGGKTRAKRAKNKHTEYDVSSTPSSSASSTPSSSASTERKGKEENRKEENRILEKERETEKHQVRRPTIEQAKSAASTIGITEDKAVEWWNAREASEWIKGMAGGGTSPVGTNWQADMTTYVKRGGYGSGNGNSKQDHRSSKKEVEFKEQIKIKQL